MPIIGNGLLAREFKKNEISDDIVIIASGVSNSKEDREEQFMRENLLIEDILFKYKRKRIVYFSTCSVLQSEQTPYIKHKIKIEETISKSGVDHYIFRLPQIVGITNNNTLLSYLIRKAYLNDPITIQKDAARNLLDVEDVSRIVRRIIEDSTIKKGIICNIATSSYTSVLDIIIRVKDILNSSSDIIIVPGGEKYYIDNSYVKWYMGEDDIIFSEQYDVLTIEKYTKKIRQEFLSQWDIFK